MKRLLYIIFFSAVTFSGWAQGSLSLYPLYNWVLKANQMNPALIPAGKMFISVPMLSGIKLKMRTDLTLDDFITRGNDDSLHIDLRKLLGRTGKKERFIMDAGFNIFQIGINREFGSIIMTASVNSYTEMTLSEDFLRLLINGNGSPDVLGKYIDEETIRNNRFTLQ